MDRRPALRVPPPVTAEGKPVEAAREKSFLEKYWIYIVVALLVMSTSFPPFIRPLPGYRSRVSDWLSPPLHQCSRRRLPTKNREAVAEATSSASRSHLALPRVFSCNRPQVYRKRTAPRASPARRARFPIPRPRRGD